MDWQSQMLPGTPGAKGRQDDAMHARPIIIRHSAGLSRTIGRLTSCSISNSENSAPSQSCRKCWNMVLPLNRSCRVIDKLSKNGDVVGRRRCWREHAPDLRCSRVLICGSAANLASPATCTFHRYRLHATLCSGTAKHLQRRRRRKASSWAPQPESLIKGRDCKGGWTARPPGQPPCSHYMGRYTRR